MSQDLPTEDALLPDRFVAYASGLDVNEAIRVRLEYENRIMVAKWSAEAGVDPRHEVELALRSLRQRVGYLEAWLVAYRRQQGEAMEQPARAPEGTR